MFVDLTIDEALTRLGGAELVLEREIVPARIARSKHNPYTAEYEWLFVVDRELARFLEPWTAEHRPALIGPGGLLTEALSNAYCHGHRRDRTVPIRVRVYAGDRGVLIQVQDSGPGFDVADVRRRLAARDQYYLFAGSGTRRMAECPFFGVFHSPDGRAVHLVHERTRCAGSGSVSDSLSSSTTPLTPRS